MSLARDRPNRSPERAFLSRATPREGTHSIFYRGARTARTEGGDGRRELELASVHPRVASHAYAYTRIPCGAGNIVGAVVAIVPERRNEGGRNKADRRARKKGRGRGGGKARP